jgi:hypothetical protein
VRDATGERLSQLGAAEADIAAAQAFGQSADHDRRTKYAADINPTGSDYGDALALPGYGTGATVAGSWYDPPRSGAPQDSA